MSINVLQPEIYNRISAGEVVEKPANVVKELVENAIDAGATSINISILGGGIEQIKVSDNGCGIEPDDLRKAFLPHATSKIKDISDLDNIFTLGFRGEALASIASVSKIQLISKSAESDFGRSISLNGGTIECEEDKGCPTGTQIIVNNLFFNTPARFKFLRKPKQEETEISNLVAKFILANPSISFTYSADNKIIYQHSKGDLKQAIYVVYGKECYDSLAEIKFTSSNLKISGYIGKPSYVKPNRTYQTLMVNGRFVNNQTVSTAVYNAFDGYLMQGKFPFFVINVKLPYEEVDVNIHPTKMEVKFQNANDVFKAVYVAVKNALNEINTIVEYKTPTHAEQVKFVNNPVELTTLNKNEGVSFSDKIEQLNVKKQELDDKIKETVSSYNSLIAPIENVETFNISSNSYVLSEMLTEKVNKLEDEKKNIERQLFEHSKSFEQQSLDTEDFSYKYIGTIFNTFIIVEKDNYCYFIDQHAGHERLLFDKLNEQLKNKNVVVQQLLIPNLVSVNHLEFEFLQSKKEDLFQLGFEIYEFGSNEFKITSVPQLLCDLNIENFFNELLKDMNAFKSISSADVLRDKLASKACKSAVKAGDILSESEIKTLIKNMLNQTTPYLCPHGRPIIIKFSKTDFEKMFKRIV